MRRTIRWGYALLPLLRISGIEQETYPFRDKYSEKVVNMAEILERKDLCGIKEKVTDPNCCR